MEMSFFRDRPDFVKLWIGLSISMLGDALLTIWSISVVYETSRSSFLVALVFLSALLPDLLFTLISGSIVDRADARKTLSVSALLQALALLPLLAGVLFFESWLVWVIIGVNICQSIANTLFQSSVAVLLPQTVGPDRLKEAHGYIKTSSSISALLGYSIGGILLGLMSSSVIVVADAVSFIVVALIALLIKKGSPAKPRERPSLSFLLAGIRFIAADGSLRLLLVYAFLCNLSLAPIMVSLPGLVSRIDPDNTMLLSWHFVALSIGSLLASLTVSSFPPRNNQLTLVVSGLAVATAIAVLSWVANAMVTLSAIAVIGSAGVYAMVVIFATVQQKTHPEMMGRVCASFNLAVQVVLPVAYLGVALLSLYLQVATILSWTLLAILGASALVAFRGASLNVVPDEAAFVR